MYDFVVYFSVFLFARQENRKVTKEKRSTQLLSMPFGHIYFLALPNLLCSLLCYAHARIITAPVRSNRMRKYTGLPVCRIQPKVVVNDCVFLFLSEGFFLFSSQQKRKKPSNYDLYNKTNKCYKFQRS